MPKDSSFWEGRMFTAVVGASRGIGQGIAIEVSKVMKKDSAMLLLARSIEGLSDTKTQVEKASPEIKVKTAPIDLTTGNNERYLRIFTDCLQELGCQASDYDHVMIVHNAGHMEETKVPVSQQEDLEGMTRFFTSNLFSTICLNTQFLKVFTKEAVAKRTVVQISAQAGLQPIPMTSLYCTVKGARDMMFQTLALEEPSMTVLCYAPGVVGTQLFNKFMTGVGADAKKVAKETTEKGVLATPSMTAQKLIKVLEEGKFKPGEHVDYYDDPSAYKSFHA